MVRKTIPTPEEESAEDDFKHRLLVSGLVARLPTAPGADADEDGDAPIDVPGEPVSETILRERR